ncbi:hypothetical protein BRO54_3501 [Geobacillus proteiniphilus]|uniref:Uncharacterized protein n=1 Tax=Geobacillus proteiniphilus TaxID=860353 RepID=A0A1Q5SLL3_9BACL|nr:hypothetical protein BRO54_3501 [Geobacillus proteiniphilus]
MLRKKQRPLLRINKLIFKGEKDMKFKVKQVLINLFILGSVIVALTSGFRIGS